MMNPFLLVSDSVVHVHICPPILKICIKIFPLEGCLRPFDPTQTLQCWLKGRNPPQKRNLLLATPWDNEIRTSQLKPWNWISVDSSLQSSDPCCRLTSESPRQGQDLQYLEYLDQTSQDFYLADLNLCWTCFLVEKWKVNEHTELHCTIPKRVHILGTRST